MQIKRAIPFVLVTLLTSCCYASQVDKLSDGLLIHLTHPSPNGAKQVKLQVISDKVIHVTATPGDQFNGAPSLMAINIKGNTVKWDAAAHNKTVVLKTASLSVTVALNSGEVTFRDGAYSNIAFHWEEAAQTLRIGKRAGSFPGMLQQRYFHVTFVNRHTPAGPDTYTNTGKIITYNGIAKTVRAI
jgi:hypothetical protein